LVDDSAEARDGYSYTVEDADLEPVPEDGPLPSVADAVTLISAESDAAVCDHHLQVANYATFEGAQLVAALYEARFPALLCTKWEPAQLDAIRPYRDRIPVLLKPDELGPETLAQGIEFCIRELRDQFIPERRPWRTQVHVVDLNQENACFFVEIPAWSRDEIVRLRLEDLPQDVRDAVGVGERFHAFANIATERYEDLYVKDWESQ
jgi:hypothetical protein